MEDPPPPPPDSPEEGTKKTSQVRSWDFSTRGSNPGGLLSFSNPRTLSEYAVSINPALLPEDEWKIESKDENLEFFQKGRDYQPRKQKHHYTEEEKSIMATYESTALKPSHTAVFRHWLAASPHRNDSESWFIIAVVAIIIGALTFGMKMICERLLIFSFPFMRKYVEGGEILRIWVYFSLISCCCGAISAVIVIYICPQAAGSGVPEIIGVLNGVVVRNILGVKILLCKITSCMFTVISALPVGFEGPMIHIGAMVGALMARPCKYTTCQSCACYGGKTSNESYCSNKCKSLCRYRDCHERHNLICMGAAAGVASAFSSPITGLCFAMEELSSHWTTALTWQTFVCCIIARSTSEMLHSTFSTLEHTLEHGKGFNILELSEAALFDEKIVLQLNMLAFMPAVIIGILGGLLGSLYIFIHLKMAKLRRRILQKFKGPKVTNVFKLVEVVILCLTWTSLIIGTMPIMYCNRINHKERISRDSEVRHLMLKDMNCQKNTSLRMTPENSESDLTILHSGKFHEGASLMFGSWEQMVRNLLSRKTADFFGTTSLSVILTIFFVFSSWSAMVSISSGLLIPQLAIGALYGRLVGKLTRDLFRDLIRPGADRTASELDIVDPGGLAVLGAASFFAGTSRQTITSVILIAEMTNDINMSLLVMVAVMLAKFVGDRFTHSMYHSLLEFKCIPILEPEMKIYHNKIKVDLELFPTSLVMCSPAVTVSLKSSVYSLANILLETNHGAFPVTKETGSGSDTRNVFVGLITRMELTILLTKTEGFDIKEAPREDIEKIRITYPEYNSTKLKDCVVTTKILQMYSADEGYQHVFVNLYPYINLSSQVVTTTFSLQRSYMIFRDLGLRHLAVVDEYNEVQGIITRKDLLGFVVEEKIKNEINRIREFDEKKDSNPKGLDPETK